MRLPIYQVAAFTEGPFAGNPAAVVPLNDDWLPDATLQAIATENNLSETAFMRPADGSWELRWFTPTVEVELCGHATLAAAYVVFRHLDPERRRVGFATRRAGVVTVSREGDDLALDFPARPPVPLAGDPPADLVAALGRAPRQVFGGSLCLAVYDNAEDVRRLAPDFARIAGLDTFGVIVTAPGEEGVDFVSRFFAPANGIDEDPATGIAHCVLVPYWAQRLGKRRLNARQLSRRGGFFRCEDRGARVTLAGRVVPYLEGSIAV